MLLPSIACFGKQSVISAYWKKSIVIAGSNNFTLANFIWPSHDARTLIPPKRCLCPHEMAFDRRGFHN